MPVKCSCVWILKSQLWVLFCRLYRASSSFCTKDIINRFRVLTVLFWRLYIVLPIILTKFTIQFGVLRTLVQIKTCCYSGYLLTSYLFDSNLYDEIDICFGASSKNCHIGIRCNWSTSTSLASVIRVRQIVQIHCDTEWRLESNSILPFLRLFPKYCISAHFLRKFTTVVAVMVVWSNLSILVLWIHWFLRCWYSVLPSSTLILI